MVKKKTNDKNRNIKKRVGSIHPLTQRLLSKFGKDRMSKNSNLEIIMLLRNGSFDTFLEPCVKQSFSYMDGEYTINTSYGRDNNETGRKMLFYHQDISTPIFLDINTDELYNEMEKHKIEARKVINPYNLKSYISSSIIEKVIKGQQLADDVSFIRKIMIIIMIVVGGNALLSAHAMGLI